MIYFAENTWLPSHDNPFTPGGGYGRQWSAFIYDDSISGSYTNACLGAKVYTLAVKHRCDRDFEKLTDFVEYEASYGRNIILKVPADAKSYIIKRLEDSTKSEGLIIRPSDAQWVVHSTTRQLWKEINETGALLSPSYLKNTGKVIPEIGIKSLMEPADYSDYIMLDILDGCGEIVVNSRQLGYICLDPDIHYIPGVRLYFDAHSIISDGMCTRDGLHVLKVFERLPLDKYMILAVDDTMLPQQLWTPTTYTEAANEYFLDYVKFKQQI